MYEKKAEYADQISPAQNKNIPLPCRRGRAKSVKMTSGSSCANWPEMAKSK